MVNLYNDYRAQKRLLMEAIVERDYMELYESSILKNDFILKLGEPRYELHKLELAIARTKLKLELMQTCIHFQIPIDSEHIDRTLQKEFEKHFKMLKIMKKEIDNVHNKNGENGAFVAAARELKEIYLTIADRVHPELIVSSNKKTSRIWKAARAAYENKDKIKLKKLQKKVLLEFDNATELWEEPQENMEKVVKQMKTKTKSVVDEINNLKKQFPFNEAKLLEDDDAVEKFRKDIYLDIEIARELLDKLEKQILEKLPPISDLLN